jgi:hypothetical protein
LNTQSPAQIKSKEFFIIGLTSNGKLFRPSDWAERLCGVLSSYRPVGRQRNEQHLAYSSYAKPIVINGVKCVVIDERLEQLEPLAMKFIMNFIKDNDLQLINACLLPDPVRSID